MPLGSVAAVRPGPSESPRASAGRSEAFCLDRLHRDLGLGHLPRLFGTAHLLPPLPHLPVVTVATQCLQAAAPSPSFSGGAESLRGPCRPVSPELAHGLWLRAGEEVLRVEADFLEALGAVTREDGVALRG